MPPKKEAKEEPPKEAQVVVIKEQEGYGRFEYQNGTVYEGQWRTKQGVKLKHGQGRLTVMGLSVANPLGRESYEGGWEEDRMSGHGTYVYAEGAVYVGEWQHGYHHGHGTYTFANGTYYEGQWANHLMHGTGTYLSSSGLLYKGEFRAGVFESRLQKALLKEKGVALKKQVCRKEGEAAFANLLEAIAKSDKKTIKENTLPFFVQGDSVKEFYREPYCKFEDRPQEKWVEIINHLKNGLWNVPCDKTELTFLNFDAVLAQQMEGVGQIIEIVASKDDNVYKLGLLNVTGSNWVIVFASEEKKK